jgi:hypothetical protein
MSVLRQVFRNPEAITEPVVACDPVSLAGTIPWAKPYLVTWGLSTHPHHLIWSRFRCLSMTYGSQFAIC